MGIINGKGGFSLFPLFLLVASSFAAVYNVGVLLPASPAGGLATQANVMKATIQMAINEINSNASIMPPGSSIQMIFQDSQTDPGNAIFAAQAVAQNASVAVIGDMVSSLSINEQYVLRYYKVPQISAQSTLDDLSNKVEFPYFMRVCPHDSISSTAVLSFVNSMRWKKIALFVVEGTENVALIQSNSFGIVVTPFIVSTDFSDVVTQLNQLNATELRVAVVLADFRSTTQILTAASSLGMIGAPRVWVGGDGLANFRSGSLPAMAGLVAVASSAGYGDSYSQFLAKLNADPFLSTILPPYQTQSKHYDATYAIAYSLSAMLTSGQDVRNGSLLLSQLLLSNFVGASGLISFNAQGDLVNPRYDILNWQVGSNAATVVGYWTQPNNLILSSSIIWPDGTTNTPSDDLASALLKVGLLLPITGPLNILAQSWLSAINFGIATVNAQGFIPGYTIVPVVRDSKADSGVALLEAFNLANEGALAVIGSGYSSDSETAQLVLSRYNIAQISGSATSDDLSNKVTYPTFFRTVPTDSIQGAALAQIVNHFGWKQIGAMLTDDSYSANAYNVFSGVASTLGITIKTQQIMHSGATDVSIYITSLKQSGALVFLMLALPGDAIVILKEAMKQGLLGANYVWLVSDGVVTISNDTLAQQGLSSLIPYMSGLVGTIASEGQGAAYETFKQQTSALNPSQYPGLVPLQSYTSFFYDCFYAYANAFKTMVSNNQDVKNTTQFISTLAKSNFTGVTGTVRFDSVYDRTNVNFAIVNWVSGFFESVGQYETGVGFSFPKQIIWPDGTTNIPSDTPAKIFEENTLGSQVVFITLASIASAALLLAMAVVFFYRESSVVHATSVVFAALVFFGGMLGFMSIVVYAISPPTEHVCRARVWVPSLAFALIYGALLSKYIHSFRVKKRSHTETRSVLMVAVPVVIVELIILVAWTAIPSTSPTPYERSTSTTNTYVTWCTYSTVFIVITMAYKGLLMLLGVFLVVSTGEYPSYYAESFYLRLANWSVIATTCLGVALVFILDGQVISMTVIYSIIVLIGVGLVMGFIFIPKCRLLILNKEGCRESTTL